MTRYRRLPGRIMGFVRCPSVWMGDDHILVVDGTRFHETYRRVYFRDVQALIIQRKRRFVMQWPYALAIPFLVVAQLQLYPYRMTIPILIVGLIAAAVLAFLSIQFGCYLDIATAVGNIRIRSVIFTWTARRLARKVTPAIVAAQGQA